MATSTRKAPTSSNTDKTPPGHDIFCTPENSHFHSKTSYRTLDASRREVRLINLLPDDGFGLIKCELLHNVPLAEVQGQYFALSYCAGDVHKTDVVLVDGVRCVVFANLRHALAAARHFFKKNLEKLKPRDGKFLMWADQICINQYDLAERSHQVGFMRDIYQCAQQTLICLSTSKSKASGMKWLLELCDNVPPREDDIMWAEPDPNQVTDLDTEKVGRQRPEIPAKLYYYLVKYIWKKIENEQFINGWISFYDMVESPWWSRAWVFQEFVASSAAYFLWWHTSVSWSDASPILHSFCFAHNNLITDRDVFLGMNGFELDGQQDRQLCRIIDRVQRTNSQAALDTIYFMVKAKIQEVSGSIDLKKLLAHSRHCKASDDRDRIFAFLGLARPGHGIVPSYSTDNDICNVLIETTKRIILFEDSLDVLSYATIPVLSAGRMLPSWVVDWTCKEVSSNLNDRPCFSVSIFHGMRNTNADASFCAIKITQRPYCTLALEVSGILVDNLVIDVTDYIDNAYEPTILSRSFSTGKYVVNTTSQAQCLDQIWILDSAPGAMILRREHHGYRLISSAAIWPSNKKGSDIEKELFKTERERILII